MRAVEFGQGWTVCRLNQKGAEMPVTLPHDAMLAEPRNEEAAGGINTGWYEGNDYRYTKVFTPSPQWEGMCLILEFEGVYHNAQVWLNGEKLLFRPYGYTNFYVDITRQVCWGQENTLEVIACNSDQPNSRWYSGAGIYRPVWLWYGPEEHISINGVRIHTTSITPPTVTVEVDTVGSGPVTIEIMDGETVVACHTWESDGTAAGDVILENGKLWDVNTPNLYTCRVTFGSDVHQCTFGIRTLSWGMDGILLNGRRVILKGACIHHDHGILGACCYYEAEERRVRILKETGYNALRSAHNPCSKALLDACDRLGMLMMDEYIDHWYIHKTEHDYVDYFMEWWQRDLKDMVEKDYNHPCVVMYSTGNEVSETAQKKGIALTGEMTSYLHSLDGTRPVTCGVNIFFNFLSSIGLGVYSDEKARKEAQKAETGRWKSKKEGRGRQSVF